MKIFTTRADASAYLNQQKNAGKTIGYVATMGALHKGHHSLINIAKKNTSLAVCSIFVNPTQFNDPKDLENYPRPVETDIRILENAKCDVLFLPDEGEMYPGNEKWHIELNGLDKILEGAHRPGHYQGVTQIVKKLLEVIKPDVAFFGQKDYQQFLIISKMVKKLRIPVQLVMCPIVREDNGLAMSSRNVRLSAAERQKSAYLFKALEQAKLNFNSKPVGQIKEDAITYLNGIEGIELEYFEICNAINLQSVITKRSKNIIALVAARVGKIRLIDNIMLR